MAASMSTERAEKAESKIAVPVDDICPGVEGSICVCGEGKRHQICAIQNGSEHVYIYDNMTRKGILQLPHKCQCMCISRDASGDEHLVCGMRDGQVMHYNLQPFRDKTKSKNKKKKDKHKNKEKPRTADPLCHQGSEEDIFGDLLEAAKTKPSCSYAQPPNVQEDELSENVVILGDAHFLLNEPCVEDLISVKGCLITCAKCAAGWTLSVYRPVGSGQSLHRPEVSGQSQLGDSSASHHVLGKKELVFDKSPGFRTFLPAGGMASSSHHSNSFANQSGALQCLGEPMGSESEGFGKSKKPQLFCMVSKSMLENEIVTTVNSAKTMILEDSLYNELFSTDFNFLNILIVLICLPDGRVFYSPLRTKGSAQVNKSNLGRTVSNWCGLNTRLFYVLDQPVASIHAFHTRLSSETEQDNRNTELLHGCDCVCVVGQYGKIVQITENDSTNQKDKLKFTESYVKGPVQTTCKTNSPLRLLYSTGQEIYSVLFSRASGESLSAAKGNRISTSFILEIGMIRAVAVVGKASKDSSRSNPVVVLTSSGKVLKLQPPADSSHDNRFPPITAAAAGKRMQELLQAINNISDRSGELAKLSETQDHILQEMSQSCHLAGLLLSNHNADRDSAIFSADMHCSFRNDGAVCELELVCQLANHSQWSLSHGWSLMMSVNADPDWTQVDEDMRQHVTKSMPLVNFRPIETVQLIFPLQHKEISLSLPVNVQCFLHFSPKGCIHSLLPEKTNLNTKSYLEIGECGIVIPLTQPKLIDLVSVLRPIQDNRNASQVTRPYQTARNRGCDWMASALQSAASTRPSANSTGCSNSEKSSEESVSVCINVSGDVTAYILEHRKCGPEDSDHNPSVQILRWLFEDNSFLTPSTNSIRLLTPDGKVVTFQCKVQLARPSSRRLETETGGNSGRNKGATSDAGKESPRREEAAEIAITAPDYLTLCQLQLAGNRRLKVVLSNARSRGITTTRDRLQKELRKVQALQRKLQSLQDTRIQHRSYGNQFNIDSTATTLELYQLMRNQLTFM